MATINLQGTQFTFSVLPLKLFSKGYFANLEIRLENEFVAYRAIEKQILREELEEWIFCMRRLLAGAYSTEHSLSFEQAGIAVDFYPYKTENGAASRQQRRENDCVMMVRLLMRSKDKKCYLGGVYSLLFHRKEIEIFSQALREEFDKIFSHLIHGSGQYRFVGVSPRGFTGCNYWYLDKYSMAQEGGYVWVKMGKHETEQIVYVDSVRYYMDDDAPYNPDLIKHVLRKTTKEELEEK